MSATTVTPSLDPQRYSFCLVDLVDQNHRQDFLECLDSKGDALIEDKEVLTKKIEEKVHYEAEFLMRKQKVVGVIVYGKDLKEISISDKSHNSLEIHLLLLKASQEAGRGYRTKLLDRVKKIAERIQAAGLCVWLSEKDESGIRYFESNGFNSVQSIEGTHREGVVSQLFFRRSQEAEATLSIEERKPSMSSGRMKRGRTNEGEVLLTGTPSDCIERDLKRHERPDNRELSTSSSGSAHSMISSSSSSSSSTHYPQPVRIPIPGKSSSERPQGVPIPIPFTMAGGSSTSSFPRDSSGSYYSSRSGSTSYDSSRYGSNSYYSSREASSSYDSPAGTQYDSPRGTQSVLRSTASSVTAKTHSIPLKKPYLDFIISGRKTIEGRINSGLMKNIKPGERIRFFCGPYEVTCKVNAIRAYRDFREMLSSEGVTKCLPEVTNLDSGVAIYHNIPGYLDKSKRFGVLAFDIIKE